MSRLAQIVLETAQTAGIEVKIFGAVSQKEDVCTRHECIFYIGSNIRSASLYHAEFEEAHNFYLNVSYNVPRMDDHFLIKELAHLKEKLVEFTTSVGDRGVNVCMLQSSLDQLRLMLEIYFTAQKEMFDEIQAYNRLHQ